MILGGLERDQPHEMGLKRNIEENRLIELTDRLQILLSFNFPWNHQKTYGFLMTAGEVDGN